MSLKSNKSIHQKQLELLGRQVLERGWMISTAESCTGGEIAAAITGQEGASAWFDSGFVTYSNGAKNKMLGVSELTLLEFGAVSREVVLEMAEGALLAGQADVSVAVSGIAGPGGGTLEKPVGYVWFAWAVKGRMSESVLKQFKGGREKVREQAVAVALEGLLRQAAH